MKAKSLSASSRRQSSDPSVIDGADRKILRSRKPSFSESIADDGYEITVASRSRAVAALSREIATAIRGLSAN